MGDLVEQHIHVHFDASDLRKAGEEIAQKTAQVAIPAGYRCQDCWRDDGGHELSCRYAMTAARGLGDVGA